MAEKIKGTEIFPDRFYRLKNDFKESQDSFWYEIHSNGKELNSVCQSYMHAQVYKGSDLLIHKDILRYNENLKIISV